MATTLFKPAGLPVFPPHDDPSGDCLLARLLRDQPHRAGFAWPQGFEAGIAHRLDTQTSGAVLAADSVEELAHLRELFQSHQLTKRYLLRTLRLVAWDRNVCDKPIAHHRTRRDRMIVQRGLSTPHRGRWYPAGTQFRCIKPHLFEAIIHTGVMHQIRVHAAFVGIPIAGDEIYGSAEDRAAGHLHLHHAGLTGPGLRTQKVPTPDWAL